MCVLTVVPGKRPNLRFRNCDSPFFFLLISGSVGKGSTLWWMILEAFMHTATYHQCRQAHNMLPEVSLAFSLRMHSFPAVLLEEQKQPQLSQPFMSSLEKSIEGQSLGRAVDPATNCCVALAWSLLSLAAVSVQQ